MGVTVGYIPNGWFRKTLYIPNITVHPKLRVGDDNNDEVFCP